MHTPGVQYRVVRSCTWSPNGIDITVLTPGTLLEANDSRVAPEFYPYALSVGWIEPIHPQHAKRTTAIPTAPETREPTHTPEPAPKRRKRA